MRKGTPGIALGRSGECQTNSLSSVLSRAVSTACSEYARSRGTGSFASGVQLSPSVGNARRGDFDGWIILLGCLKVKTPVDSPIEAILLKTMPNDTLPIVAKDLNGEHKFPVLEAVWNCG